MKTTKDLMRLLTIFATLGIVFSFSGIGYALDDGARAYWNGRHGTNVMSIQHLRLDMETAGDNQPLKTGPAK